MHSAAIGKYFSQPLEKQDGASALFFSVKEKIYSYLFLVIDTLNGRTVDKSLQRLQARNLKKIQSYCFKLNERPAFFPESYFRYLVEKKFKNLFRSFCCSYFERKIKAGELTLDALQAGSKVKYRSVQEFVKNHSPTHLSKMIEQTEIENFLKTDPEMVDLLLALKESFIVKSCAPQDLCIRNFLELFSHEEKNGKSAWKLTLAQRVAHVKESDLPAFMHSKLRYLIGDLPRDYEEKVIAFQKKQKEIADGAKKGLGLYQKIFDGVFDLEKQICCSSGFSSIDEVLEDAANGIHIKYAESSPNFPRDQMQDSLPHFVHVMVDVLSTRSIWLARRPEVTEAEFLEVYKNCDPISLNFAALEEFAIGKAL